jgi:hypothetical protein
MTSTNLLWFGLGMAIGYVFIKKDWGTRVVKPIAETALQAGKDLAVDVKDTVLDTAKMTKCEADWLEIAKVSKFGSKESADKAKKDFMASCMAK